LGRGAMPPHKASLGSERVYQVMAWLASNNPSLKKLK
jgi:cytochrome c oxidase cbb3-type subunit III